MLCGCAGEELLVLCQAPALLGLLAVLDVNAPSALCASLHCLCLMIAGKKSDFYTYSLNSIKMHPIIIFICKELTAKVPDVEQQSEK